jgi:hypothetical protein
VRCHASAKDALDMSSGGASCALPADPRRRTAAWITLDRTAVSLPPGAAAVVPFTVAVPPDVAGGQYLAGLSIGTDARDDSDTDRSTGQTEASVDVRTRRIIAVQLDLPTDEGAELIIDGVTDAARPDGLYVEVRASNRGRRLTKAQGILNIDEDFERRFDVDTFVPDTEIAYPIRWSRERTAGTHRATVELRYGNQVARWRGTFTVGDAVQEELEDRLIESGQPPASRSSLGRPLGLLATVVGCLGLCGALVVMIVLRQPRGRHARRSTRRFVIGRRRRRVGLSWPPGAAEHPGRSRSPSTSPT